MTASLDFALHRKPHTRQWSIVFSRAYGMAASQLFCTLNDPGSSFTSPSPRNQFHLNPNPSFGCTLEELLAAEPPILRTVGLPHRGLPHRETSQSLGAGEVEVPLVEVLLSDDELARRCAGCGEWETTPLDKRWAVVGEAGSEGETVYWCGVSFYLSILFIPVLTPPRAVIGRALSPMRS
jgi:hypothetical protein